MLLKNGLRLDSNQSPMFNTPTVKFPQINFTNQKSLSHLISVYHIRSYQPLSS